MRELINIVEGFAKEDGFTQSRLFQAIYKHRRAEVVGDEDLTWDMLRNEIRELKAQLRFPLTVYRAMQIGDDLEELSPEAIIKQIDFSRIGTSWTWDKNTAIVSGALGDNYAGSDERGNVLLEAKVTSTQCDYLSTFYHNLTVYREEKEVRLFANTPIKITNVVPSDGLRFPIRANTGPAADPREGILQDMRNALRKDGEPYHFVKPSPPYDFHSWKKDQGLTD